MGGAESLAKPSTLAAVGSDSLPAERRCGEHNVIGVSGILRTCPLSFVRYSTTYMPAYTIAGPSRGWIGNVILNSVVFLVPAFILTMRMLAPRYLSANEEAGMHTGAKQVPL